MYTRRKKCTCEKEIGDLGRKRKKAPLATFFVLSVVDTVR